MNFYKDNIPFIILLIVIVITIFDFWLQRRLRDFNKQLARKRTTLENIKEQIIAILIKHRGKMSRLEMCNYFDLPIDLVARELIKMEKEGIVSRKGLIDDFVGLNENWHLKSPG